jgi:hypothetical protein
MRRESTARRTPESVIVSALTRGPVGVEMDVAVPTFRSLTAPDHTVLLL